MTFLDASGQSARGLLQFFQVLQGEEMLAGIREDPYLRTHPLTAQRIDYVRNHVEHSRFSNAPDAQTNIELLKRIKVKLDASSRRLRPHLPPFRRRTSPSSPAMQGRSPITGFQSWTR